MEYVFVIFCCCCCCPRFILSPNSVKTINNQKKNYKYSRNEQTAALSFIVETSLLNDFIITFSSATFCINYHCEILEYQI